MREALSFTPYSRDEFNLSFEPSDDDFERARRMIVRSFQGFGSTSANGKKTGFRANSNRSGTTPAHDWHNYSEALDAIIERLRGVCIENKDAQLVMTANDTEETLHYVDPPYVLDTRYKGQKTNCYNHEMINDQHEELCAFLDTLSGTVILSGYDNDLYNSILVDWHKVYRKSFADGARERTEVIWMNRNDHMKQKSLNF